MVIQKAYKPNHFVLSLEDNYCGNMTPLKNIRKGINKWPEKHIHVGSIRACLYWYGLYLEAANPFP